MLFLFGCTFGRRILYYCWQLHKIDSLAFLLRLGGDGSGLLCLQLLVLGETFLCLHLWIDWVEYLLCSIHRYDGVILGVGVLFQESSFSFGLNLVFDWVEIIQARRRITWTTHSSWNFCGLVQHFACYWFGLLWLLSLDLNLSRWVGVFLKSASWFSHTKLIIYGNTFIVISRVSTLVVRVYHHF